MAPCTDVAHLFVCRETTPAVALPILREIHYRWLSAVSMKADSLQTTASVLVVFPTRSLSKE